MTVLTSSGLQPASLEAHEIAEGAGVAVQCGGKEGEVSRRKTVHLLAGQAPAEIVQQATQDVGTCIVVRAVAMMEIRHSAERVLEDTGAVGHAHEVVELERRQPLLVICGPTCKSRAWG